MKKQYMSYEAGSFRYIIELYHDGILIDSQKKWMGDELDKYINELKQSGYEKAYSETDVMNAKARYEYLLARSLVKTNDCFYDLYFLGIKKQYLGFVDIHTFAIDIANAYGYYREDDKYVIFVTDADGEIICHQSVNTERKLQNSMRDFLSKHHIVHLERQWRKEQDKYKQIFADYLMDNFNIEEWESKWDYFVKQPTILIELLYFMMYNRFVSDKCAYESNNYTVKKICQNTVMDVFESFRFMVLLIENPDEALSIVKKK